MLTELSSKEIMADIKKRFVIGGHKAASINQVLSHTNVYLVSQLPHEKLVQCGIIPYSNLESAVKDALKKMGDGCTIAILPEGASILPDFKVLRNNNM